jgi:hypothetical protein
MEDGAAADPDRAVKKAFLSFGTINETQWAAAVTYLRRRLPDPDRQRIANEMHLEGLDQWTSKHHFPVGMGIRNILRRGGFSEGRLGIPDLDMAWGLLLSEAVDEPACEADTTDEESR